MELLLAQDANSLYKQIQAHGFDFEYRSDRNELTIEHDFGDIALEFMITYDYHWSDYASATNFNPTESKCVFENIEICEISLYRNEDVVTIKSNVISRIKAIIESKI